MLTYCAGVPVEGLPKRARLMIGLGLGVIGTVGLVVSDKLEERMPAAEQPKP